MSSSEEILGEIKNAVKVKDISGLKKIFDDNVALFGDSNTKFKAIPVKYKNTDYHITSFYYEEEKFSFGAVAISSEEFLHFVEDDDEKTGTSSLDVRELSQSELENVLPSTKDFNVGTFPDKDFVKSLIGEVVTIFYGLDSEFAEGKYGFSSYATNLKGVLQQKGSGGPYYLKLTSVNGFPVKETEMYVSNAATFILYEKDKTSKATLEESSYEKIEKALKKQGATPYDLKDVLNFTRFGTEGKGMSDFNVYVENTLKLFKLQSSSPFEEDPDIVISQKYQKFLDDIDNNTSGFLTDMSRYYLGEYYELEAEDLYNANDFLNQEIRKMFQGGAGKKLIDTKSLIFKDFGQGIDYLVSFIETDDEKNLKVTLNSWFSNILNELVRRSVPKPSSVDVSDTSIEPPQAYVSDISTETPQAYVSVEQRKTKAALYVSKDPADALENVVSLQEELKIARSEYLRTRSYEAKKRMEAVQMTLNGNQKYLSDYVNNGDYMKK